MFELLGDGLEAHGDLADLLHPVVGGAAHELQVVHDQHIKPVGPLETPRPGGQLGDGDRGGVVNEKRA